MPARRVVTVCPLRRWLRSWYTITSSQVVYVHTHGRQTTVEGLVLEILICNCFSRSLRLSFRLSFPTFLRSCCPSPCLALSELITQLIVCRWGTSDIPQILTHREHHNRTYTHRWGMQGQSMDQGKGCECGRVWQRSVTSLQRASRAPPEIRFSVTGLIYTHTLKQVEFSVFVMWSLGLDFNPEWGIIKY